ncbi:TPA: 30S ribosomal protein S3 [Candidatus Uhrbacteria bacterium]|nr:30S ribosomal protein S3 [Candidatus Uhrbacteria bacterium]
MGHKVHPKIFRISTIGSWDSKWFSPRKTFPTFLKEDVYIRAYLKKKLREAAIHKIIIDRSRQTFTITLHTAKPGFIIGRAGAGVEDLKKELKQRFFRGKRVIININVQDIGHGSLSAAVVADQVAMDIEHRMPFRRVMKQTVDRVMKGGAEGVRVIVAGRLNGGDIARSERAGDGKVPLQNLRGNIQYARAEANTMFGVIGVKVWIYLGEVFDSVEEAEIRARKSGDSRGREREQRGSRDRRPAHPTRR